MSNAVLLIPGTNRKHFLLTRHIERVINKHHSVLVINNSLSTDISIKIKNIQQHNPDFILALYTINGDDDFINSVLLGVFTSHYTKNTKQFEEKLQTLIEVPKDPKKITEFLRKSISMKIRNISFKNINHAKVLTGIILQTR